MASRYSQVSVNRAEIEADRNPPQLDTDGAARLAALRTSSALPTQTTFSSTFPGIHRDLWRVDWFPIEPKGSLGKLLAIAIGSYPTCTDCSPGLRLMGFANGKNDPAYHGTVEYSGDSTWDSDDFRLGIPASDAIFWSRTFTARKHPSNATDPEHDCSWVLHELARGKVAAKLTRKLTSRRAGKPNSLYYAQTTVDGATAGLWLVQSVPIDAVVTVLEVRRRLRIPLGTLPPSCAGAHSLFAGGDGVILRSISMWSKNGASHRVNCDTPPLGGNCRETCECSRGTILASGR